MNFSQHQDIFELPLTSRRPFIRYFRGHETYYRTMIIIRTSLRAYVASCLISVRAQSSQKFISGPFIGIFPEQFEPSRVCFSALGRSMWPVRAVQRLL